MQSNYRPIGDYVKRVDRRNKDLKVTRLFGLSMTKEFRETTSNIVGTDMSVYRVMHKHEFACDFMSPIRVNKLPVVLKLDDEPNLVSPAYPVFKVKDPNLLDPEYLMMWFRRSEFDRYATFKCDAAIRGGYDWQALCETLIPVPSIEKQREIVAEYHTIQTRIALNNQLIKTLETTAQAIYKQWFVEFEFPNEAGQPYKSSGGEMVDSELGEIPKGWEAGMLSDATSYMNRGITPIYTDGEGVVVINQKCVRNNSLDFSFTRNHALKMKAVAKDKFLQHFDVLVNSTGEGTLGRVGLVKEKPTQMTVDTHVTIVRPSEDITPLYLWYSLSSRTEDIEKLAEGSTGQTELGRANLGSLPMLLPTNDIQQKFALCMNGIISHSSKIEQEASILLGLSNLLLSKLATIETVPAASKPAATEPTQLTLSFI